MIIASLLRNPEYYGKIEKDISKEDFSSDDNKRIFSAVVEKIKDQRSLELTFFTQELTPQQMDMLVKIGKKYEIMDMKDEDNSSNEKGELTIVDRLFEIVGEENIEFK